MLALRVSSACWSCFLPASIVSAISRWISGLSGSALAVIDEECGLVTEAAVAELAAAIEGRQEFIKGSRQRLEEIGERATSGKALSANRRQQLASLREQLEDIVRAKEPDLTAADMDAAVRTIAGTARSMGIDVEGVN